MKQPQNVIKRMTMTEKGSRLSETANQYVLEVHPDANKIEIKRAVEQLFKVTVRRVNTLNRMGRETSARRSRAGVTAAVKRAIVTLKQGDKIDLT
jgi:large subunit ribosomal protein L23